MDTTKYLFQSPYNSQVQFGRPDPVSEQKEKTQNTLNSLTTNTNTIVNDAQKLQQSQTQEVTPTLKSSNQLDVYA